MITFTSTLGLIFNRTATSSDIYKDSEELIGKWFKRCGKRSDIFLATKFAVTAEGIRGDAAYVKEAAARSLKRLGIESIDLYYMHRCVICECNVVGVSDF